MRREKNIDLKGNTNSTWDTSPADPIGDIRYGFEISDIPLPSGLWRIGDIVSRDGTDEHEIIKLKPGDDIMDVKCIKEPAIHKGSSEPWTRLGDEESNLVRRYSFVRCGNLDHDTR